MGRSGQHTTLPSTSAAMAPWSQHKRVRSLSLFVLPFLRMQKPPESEGNGGECIKSLRLRLPGGGGDRGDLDELSKILLGRRRQPGHAEGKVRTATLGSDSLA